MERHCTRCDCHHYGADEGCPYCDSSPNWPLPHGLEQTCDEPGCLLCSGVGSDPAEAAEVLRLLTTLNRS